MTIVLLALFAPTCCSSKKILLLVEFDVVSMPTTMILIDSLIVEILLPIQVKTWENDKVVSSKCITKSFVLLCCIIFRPL
jgi:hypothetical protein